MKSRRFIYCITFIFLSQKSWAADGPPGPRVDRSINYSTRLAPYLTDFTHKFHESAAFDCPGDSFLTGLRSQYSDGDRRFAYICSFPENTEKKIMKKPDTKKCYFPKQPDVIFGQKGGASHCPADYFVHSMLSAYAKAQNEEYKGTKRTYAFGCCSMNDWSGKQFATTPNSCVKYEHIHDSGDAFTFSCKQDYFIGKIEAEPSGGDMLMSVTCCLLK